MAKYELKQKSTMPVFLNLSHPLKRIHKKKNCKIILEMMKDITKMEPKMHGSSIVGFGSYRYKYNSGHEGEACLMGFSPRKQNTTLYLALKFSGSEDIFKALGKHKVSKVCLYIKKLEDIDSAILKKLVAESFKYIKKKYVDPK